MTRVLLVKNAARRCAAFVINLQACHYGVDAAPDGTMALRPAAARRPDVLLHLDLPTWTASTSSDRCAAGPASPSWCYRLRARSEEKVAALDADTDDYIIEPFSMDVLPSRLHAAARHTETAPIAPGMTLVQTDELIVGLVARNATRQRHDVRQTNRMAPAGDPDHQPRPPRHAEGGAGVTKGNKTNYLRVRMAQLRRKLEKDPPARRYVITEPRMGYRCEA
ncbi:DNA-binding response regulator [Streptomyces malachitofuscus]|nr:DNA-binding response regulator [Streptomyces malachitofuscus]